MKIARESLHKQLKNVLIHNNIREEDAEIIAEVLIEGNLRGYSHHGVDRIYQILDGIKQGTINPIAYPSLIVDCPANAVFDGNLGPGQPIGKKAMELAIEKAKEIGVGIVGVINASHLGILAYYSELASRCGCIGIVMTTSSPAVVIKGGKIKTFGTNPISYSIPNQPYPITADFSTSKISRGLIYDYLNKGKKIPLGWAVDHRGHNTTNPKKALEGGLKAFDDDVKGCLLSFLISILAGNLIGGVINPHVTGTRYMDKTPNKGDLFMAFNIEKFTNKNVFAEGIQELVNFINMQNAEFRIPGKRSHQNREKFMKNIIISHTLNQLFDYYR